MGKMVICMGIKMEFIELSNEELLYVDGGSIWKYIGAFGMIGFGAYQVSTGVGVVNGGKNIFSGVCVIGTGIYGLIS